MLKNIIFPGGGLKGWAYIGTIRALTELIDYSVIEQVIGTSIGSLFGLCYVLQIEWSYLLDFIINLDFKEMIDIDIDSILVTQSLLEGKKYQQLLREVIREQINPQDLEGTTRTWIPTVQSLLKTCSTLPKLDNLSDRATKLIKVAIAYQKVLHQYFCI